MVGCFQLKKDENVYLPPQHEVDAIHPGYGFLSERADYANEVEKAGSSFIGPSPPVMARMVDKVAARRSAIEAGVRVVPGTDHPITTAEGALKFAQEYGTPIILKAAFGCGGRGMRRVDDVKQVPLAFEMASREALANFGNGSMFVEKFIENPRHIEVQLMGDNHGNVIHLYERDCSVAEKTSKRHQSLRRRGFESHSHQYVLQILPFSVVEIPAPHLGSDVRQRLLDNAVKGTVEFLFDKDGKQYFIEVNARLQVEHTVTEDVTGVDLIQKQIRVAEGRSLNLEQKGLEQKKIQLNVAAIQCRLTAEDRTKAVQPDSGTLEVYPTGDGMGICIDGVTYDGCKISPYYGSMLCKIISHASNHKEAARKLTISLIESRILGVKVDFECGKAKISRIIPQKLRRTVAIPELLPIKHGEKLLQFGNFMPMGLIFAAMSRIKEGFQDQFWNPFQGFVPIDVLFWKPFIYTINRLD